LLVPIVYLRFAPSRRDLQKHDAVADEGARIPAGTLKS